MYYLKLKRIKDIENAEDHIESCCEFCEDTVGIEGVMVYCNRENSIKDEYYTKLCTECMKKISDFYMKWWRI